MGKGNWFRRERQHAQGKSRRKSALTPWKVKTLTNRTRLEFEELEDRRVLATFVVINDLDTNPDNDAVYYGSLRWAVNQANATAASDDIVFSDDFFEGGAAQINLNLGQLNITQPLQILGPGATKLTVTADADSRIFNLNIGTDEQVRGVTISGLTLSGGNITGDDDADRGGAIYSREALVLTEVIVRNSRASQGGGGVYAEFGSLTVDRSLFQNNEGRGVGGGGILSGSGDDDSQPLTTIANSTFYANRAPAGGTNVGFGGGVLNRNGRMEIWQSTFFDNSSGSGFGEGVASWGNPVPEEEGGDPPPETVKTIMTHTVVYREGGESDVAVVGESEDDPPVPLLPSFENEGYNLIGALGDQVEAGEGDLAPGTDPQLKDLDDYGGSIPVMLPNNDPEDPDFDGISPLIDAGNPDRTAGQAGRYEQRGRHFVRIYNMTGTEEAIIDIGASEVQAGMFFVDSLVDESDYQYSGTTERLSGIIDGNLEGGSDFSLREALEFSFKNPELDTILFADSLKGEYDPTLSPAPTILLSPDFGYLSIDHEVIIEGPSTFILEIDATGTDETPTINDGFGSHVFSIDDNDAENLLNIEISNLTLMGADQVGPGGGIYLNENLTLRHVTMKDNFSTLAGGAIFAQFGNLTVYDSTFNNNSTSGNGGAIYLNYSATDALTNALIVNSTISGNTAAGRGAGIGNRYAHLVLRNSTITLNSAASTRGSGVYAFTGSLTEVYSSIISGNLNNDIEYDTSANNVVSLGYNLVGRGNASFAFNDIGDRRNILNPMLAPLANTGGFIQTHRPLVGSPIIDAGNPADVAGEGDTPATDQRGGVFVRIYDATGMGAGPGIIDIGAYELQPALLIVDSIGDGDDGDYSQNNLTLREAIKIANENPLHDFIDLAQVTGQIQISGTSIAITDSVTIEGSNWFDMRIFGTTLTTGPMFVIDDGSVSTTIDVYISGLAIESARMGGIKSSENLYVDRISFQANRNTTSGGAIFQQNGSVEIYDSQFNGNSTSGANGDGGAIYAIGSEISIFDTILVGNTAFATGADGGGVALNNSVLNATRALISGNQTPGGTSDGGGIYATGALSQINLNDSTVSGNYTTGSNSEGGGIASYGGAVNLVDSVISLNRTAGSQSTGGGIYLNGGTLSALRSIVTQNSTTGLNAPGAGIAMVGGSASIVETSIQGNTTSSSGGHGGGIYNVGGTLIVRDSSIVENFATHAQSKGGGVYSDTNLAGTQSTLILNTTISGNTAAFRGAGVFNVDGLLEIYHSTITNNLNTATPFTLVNSGNGVASQGTTATQTKIYSSIIAGNGGAATGTGTDVDFVDGNGVNSVQSLGYNVIGVGNVQSVFNKTGDQAGITNPLLAPLEDNSDPDIPTINPFTVLTHALLADSPAINAGSPTFNPNVYNPALNFDQRGEGYARVNRGRIDVGAFESNLAPALPSDFNGDSKVDGSDFLSWQRNFGKTTGATKDQGDANNDGQVNSTDLSFWKNGYGSVADGPAPMAAASSTAAAVTYTASMLAVEEPGSTVGSQAAALMATAPAEFSSSSSSSVSTLSTVGGYDSLASLGGPTRAAAKTPAAYVVDDSLLWNDGTVSKSPATSIYLDESRSEELDSLFSADEAEGAGDEVFAAWGEELL